MIEASAAAWPDAAAHMADATRLFDDAHLRQDVVTPDAGSAGGWGVDSAEGSSSGNGGQGGGGGMALTAARIVVTPTSLTFDKVAIGDTVDKVVTVRNEGEAVATGLLFERSGSEAFSIIATTCSPTLSPAAPCSITCAVCSRDLGIAPGGHQCCVARASCNARDALQRRGVQGSGA